MLIRNKILSKSHESRIEEVKEDLNLSIEKENKIRFLQNEILSLRDKLEQKEEVQEKSDKYSDLLNDLFYKGIIDSNGNFIEE